MRPAIFPAPMQRTVLSWKRSKTERARSMATEARERRPAERPVESWTFLAAAMARWKRAWVMEPAEWSWQAAA